jgi:hypothetical protein
MLDGHAEYAIKDKYKGLFSDYFLADGQGNAAVQVSAMESLMAQKPGFWRLSVWPCRL